ncbi:hypothetical protein [Silanimonas sp.]|uniref:hypothetical protein n=1 Tax=Silanimonas sp. TaxID=1929290 RepID=UPI0022C4A5BC|nr:hypothetical protein [Silanimonas sp.]MCZ8166198.1 hypothetical protein [Silanimonas sp.]
MGEVYRRLGETLPPGLRAELPFGPDAKRAAGWIETLPRADVAATRRALLRALEALSSTHALKGATRREIAEVLRPAIIDNALSTQRLFAGKPLPLAGDLAGLPGELEQLHLRLAHAYRMAAADQCAPSGSLPWLRGGQVAEAAQRATYHYGEALLVAWRVYADLPVDAWRGLHRTYRFAVERELERRPSSDPLVSGLPTIHQRYVELLLMHVVNPRAFSQPEQERVWAMCEAFAARTPLRDTPSATAVGVADDADEGPGGKAPPRQHLDLVGFAAAVEAALAASDGESATVMPEHGVPVKMSADGLRKLRRAFSHAAARQFTRLDAGHTVETVFGLSGLHYQASGERDFDAFARQVLGDALTETARASWSAGGAEVSARSARIPALVVDQSLGGYRMRWAQDNHLRLRVGEVVGIHVGDQEDPSDWMLGILRWLRYEADGQVMAGVELLSRAAGAVALMGTGAANRAPLRALELRPPYGGGDWLYLAAQRLPQGEALRIGREQEPVDQLLDRRPEDRLSDPRLVQILGDYFLYRYAPANAAHS